MTSVVRRIRHTYGAARLATVALVTLALLAAMPGRVQAQEGCQFVGDVGYAYGGNTAVLTADQIKNLDASGLSGTVRVELWALTAPYTGSGGMGYKLAQFTVGQLPAGASLYNLSSGSVAFTSPPSGTWTLVLLLTEFSGGVSDDGYAPTDWRNLTDVLIDPLATPATLAIEYYYAAWDYYFVTSFPNEIAVLDGGAFGGVW